MGNEKKVDNKVNHAIITQLDIALVLDDTSHFDSNPSIVFVAVVLPTEVWCYLSNP